MTDNMEIESPHPQEQIEEINEVKTMKQQPMKQMKTTKKTMKSMKTVVKQMKQMKAMKDIKEDIKDIKDMKVMKVMKAMKVPMKVKKVSVFHGTHKVTSGRLKSDGLIKNQYGRIVSKKQQQRGKQTFEKHGLGKWSRCVSQARKDLNITGFCACGGPKPEGQQLLALTRKYYKKPERKQKQTK